jgi:tetratricopeptide (TPR) repeat protein
VAEVHTSLGGALRAMGRTSEAIAELKTAVGLAPSSDDAHRRLGSAYMQAGQLPEGVAELQQAVDLNPFFWRNRTILSTALRQLGRYDEGIAQDLEGLKLAPTQIEMYTDLGAAYIDAGRPAEAREVLEKGMTIKRNYPMLTNLASVYEELGDFPRARELFAEAAQLKPDELMAQANLGDGERYIGALAVAKVAYQRAIDRGLKDLEANPRLAVTRALLAMAYANVGDRDNAEKLMASALAIDKTGTDVLYYQVKVMALLGETDRAIAGLGPLFDAGYLPVRLTKDPDLAAVRADPRYAAALAHAKPASPR